MVYHLPKAGLSRDWSDGLLDPIYVARMRRDFDAAELLFRRRIAHSPRPELIRSFARMLVEIGRAVEAASQWSALYATEPTDFEACYHIARSRVRIWRPAAKAVDQIATNSSNIFKSRLLRVLTKPIATLPPDPSFRHIAICGASYCGSTLIDRLLGSLPGVASIGESHWLTSVRQGSRLVDFNAVDLSTWPQCAFCGTGCQTLTEEFRTDLAADHTNWYQKIAARLKTSTLISADKNWAKIIENDPLLRLDALVIFKSPLQAWRSHRSHLPQDQSPEFYETALEKYLPRWGSQYLVHLEDFRPKGQTVFVWFDEFAASRGAALQTICDKLALPYDASVLERIRPGHSMEGNAGTVARFRSSNLEVKVEPLLQSDIPANERDIIAANHNVQALFEALQSRRVRFPAC